MRADQTGKASFSGNSEVGTWKAEVGNIDGDTWELLSGFHTSISAFDQL
ncbi:MAG: hypothetical protein O3B68_16315 [Planctomycetota bacterium]|nr:hypothetical protein [Planctomycetota bacterium]